ncbi:p53 and DNA damage-regulated protein 1 [Aplysia californica]|uniref:P53 and DNA damage-regulated protein 1 n=1 Tax=Aplysia californica TaxID=6500 RepID=A0ABM0K5J6_APLCA|nr:p53 and DNA damage-regulated protein 1 [Aplysia californica]
MDAEEGLSSIEASDLLKYLTEIEMVAEDVLSSRREIIDLDRQRNKTREAVRALQKDKHRDKTWLCAGNMFLKVEKSKAISTLTKDYDELDAEINKVRSGLRPKVNKLRDLEKKEDLKGFDLDPLTPDEKRSVESLLL